MIKKIISLSGAVMLTVLLMLNNGQATKATPSLQTTAQATLEATAAADPLGGATTFAKANQVSTVTMMLDWTPNTNHIGLYVAQALGYYTEANLAVDIVPPGDVLVDQVVGNNTAQFGISYQEGFTFSRAGGVPIVSVAAVIQHNTSGFAALHSKHILQRPADLTGLRYGAFGSPVEKSFLDALLKCDNVVDNKIEFIDVGFADPLPLLERDRVDFVWLFYGWDGLRAKLSNAPLDFVMLQEYADCVPDYYTPILITNETMIKDQPDVVAAFVQATARGYAYAIQHPEEAADILLRAAPELDPALVKDSMLWLASQYQAEAPRWGEQRLAIWEGFTKFLRDNHILDKDLTLDQAFTNQYLPGKGN